MPLIKIEKQLPTTGIDSPRIKSSKSSSLASTDAPSTLREKNRDGQRDYIAPPPEFPGRHRWNPEASWSTAEEKALVRKIDLRLLLCFCIMSVGMQMDRGNLLNAVTDNFLTEAHLTTTDFGRGLTLNWVAVLICELPIQVLILRFGFRRVFPPLLIGWGIASICQVFIRNQALFYALRFVVGICESGHYPGMIYFFTQFYLHRELYSRLAIMSAMTDLAQVIASLSAAGILKMRGIGNKPGWFWLFLIEGLIVFSIGVFCYLYLPRSPVETKSVICRKSWFNDREEVIVVNRVLRDDPTKGNGPGSIKPTVKDVLHTWSDRKIWILLALGFLGTVAHLPMRQYLSITLRKLGFSTFHSNMLSIPGSILQMISVLVVSWSSQHFNERTWHCVFAHVFPAPFFAALVATPPDASSWQRYSLIVFVVGSPSFYPIVASWLSESSFSIKKRAIAVSTFSLLAVAGAIVGSQVYQEADEPYYYTANKALIGVILFTCILIVAQKYVVKRINRHREIEWEKLTLDEQKEYQKETEQMRFDGNTRLDFRFPY